MKPVNFGIDLGTTNSLIARFDQGNVIIYKNPVGHKETLASVVAFRRDRILVGDKAREFMLKDPVNVFGGFKRKMGTDEKMYVVNLDENVTPQQLSVWVLKELQRFVHSGEPVEAAVITIPASFDTMQSNATRQAGLDAGMQEVFLLQEPVAASLAYFNQSQEESHEGYWMVYDLGGGTFDVALVQIDGTEMKVVDHEGNNFLGGLDFDLMIVEGLIVPEIARISASETFAEDFATPFGKYEKLYYELLYKAEELKKELTIQPVAELDCHVFIEGLDYDFTISITRMQFEELIRDRIQGTIQMLQAVLLRNHLHARDVRQVVLVGGSTYIPYVRRQLEEQTGIRVNKTIDPTTAVVVGAAYYAANKYYLPKDKGKNAIRGEEDIDLLLSSLVNEKEQATEEQKGPEIQLMYGKMSREQEEVLLVKVQDYEDVYLYRIIRADGGFDTGFVPLKSKFTEFLPLLPGVENVFYFRVYNNRQVELSFAKQEIRISQGQYQIAGQPLPKDICLEVDDRENFTTRLELVFEKNSILPLKKTIYREVSKTVRKGAEDKIIINILEGDRFARPISNLSIGCIEISGKDLKSDLVKGSDIELTLYISDDRQLTTELYLVMTEQSFQNVFTLAEKQISIERLQEQFYGLEEEIRSSTKSFGYDAYDVWEMESNGLLSELLGHKKDLMQLRANDRSDKKYVIAEAVSRISQAYDKIGGSDRLQYLQSEYLHTREYVEEQLKACDFDRDRLNARFLQLTKSESQLLRTRNPSILIKATEQLNRLAWDVLMNTTSYLIVRFEQIKTSTPSEFTNYKAAQNIFKMADKALEQERYFEFRQHVYNLTHLIRYEQNMGRANDFKGTGIG